jgi:hypothetical protein
MFTTIRATRRSRNAFLIRNKLSRVLRDSITAFGAQYALHYCLVPVFGMKIVKEPLDAPMILLVPREIDLGELVGNHGTEELHQKNNIQFSFAPSSTGYVHSF